jgi:hypothetical protein
MPPFSLFEFSGVLFNERWVAVSDVVPDHGPAADAVVMYWNESPGLLPTVVDNYIPAYFRVALNRTLRN